MAKKLTYFSSVAVSGQSCSGKSTLCNLLANQLCWTHVDIGAEFRKLVINNRLEIEQFGHIPEDQLHKIDEQIAGRILTEPYRVWDGRLACYLSQQLKSVLRVYCTAPIEIRSQRLAKREKMSIQTAWAKIEKRDAEEQEVFERMYALSDPYNPKWIDLRVETLGSPEALILPILNRLMLSY
ncbi:MAG: cytidylate kinase family protein [Candidatus Bathyarchaeia archaeon]|jgi:cytidylate kinase